MTITEKCCAETRGMKPIHIAFAMSYVSSPILQKSIPRSLGAMDNATLAVPNSLTEENGTEG